MNWGKKNNNIHQWAFSIFTISCSNSSWLNVPARRGQHCIVCQTNLQGSRHEYRAAHEQEDDQASEPLFSDAQEARLLSWSRALRLQLQTVDVRDGQDRGCYEPGQTHDGAHCQHHPDHQQVQVVPTALLHNRKGQTGDRWQVTDITELQPEATVQRCRF